MLFVSLILLTIGYTMVFAALHGNWQFWSYFFPGGGVVPTTGRNTAG